MNRRKLLQLAIASPLTTFNPSLLDQEQNPMKELLYILHGYHSASANTMRACSFDLNDERCGFSKALPIDCYLSQLAHFHGSTARLLKQLK